MPYTPAQHRLFEAAKHDPAIAKKHHLSQSTAAKLASEGVKKTSDVIKPNPKKK